MPSISAPQPSRCRRRPLRERHRLPPADLGDKHHIPIVGRLCLPRRSTAKAGETASKTKESGRGGHPQSRSGRFAPFGIFFADFGRVLELTFGRTTISAQQKTSSAERPSRGCHSFGVTRRGGYHGIS